MKCCEYVPWHPIQLNRLTRASYTNEGHGFATGTLKKHLVLPDRKLEFMAMQGKLAKFKYFLSLATKRPDL